MPKIKDLFDIMEEIAPQGLAEEWDNCGLQIGNPANETTGVLIALDPSLEAVKTAASKGSNLLITHHPLFFSNVTRLDLTSPEGKVIEEAVRSGISLFAAHTNLDSASGGINDILASLFNLTNSTPIAPSAMDGDKKSGMGRIGDLPEALTVRDTALLVKQCLKTQTVRIAGNRTREVKRVALCSGSGGTLLKKAAKLGADIFISGDIRYHQAKDAEDIGMALIDAGHFASEKIVTAKLADKLQQILNKKGFNIPVESYDGEKEPFTII
ncbi:MAG: Nif3-like dinuclear metal center hexameric protein [Proteobacteria bacterium]|nr:Nif3-like dinuclear metal center hexameric protein [Pseudomonadota bacterium]